jgi:hypothetical protein
MYLFLFLTLYMFRAHRAHHQERQIVSIQPLVTVTLCRWPCRVQVGSELWSFTKNKYALLLLLLLLLLHNVTMSSTGKRRKT